MDPASPTDPRQALEASLTAMLLVELPEDQAAFLRQAIANDAELARMHERLKVTIGLVRETAVTPVPQAETQTAPLKLNDARRQELLQRFKTVRPKEFARPRRKWLVVELAVAAGVVGLLSILILPAVSRSKSKAQLAAAYHRNWSFSPWASTPVPSATDESLSAGEKALRPIVAPIPAQEISPTERERPRAWMADNAAQPPAAKPAQTTIVLPTPQAGEAQGTFPVGTFPVQQTYTPGNGVQELGRPAITETAKVPELAFADRWGSPQVPALSQQEQPREPEQLGDLFYLSSRRKSEQTSLASTASPPALKATPKDVLDESAQRLGYSLAPVPSLQPPGLVDENRPPETPPAAPPAPGVVAPNTTLSISSAASVDANTGLPAGSLARQDNTLNTQSLKTGLKTDSNAIGGRRYDDFKAGTFEFAGGGGIGGGIAGPRDRAAGEEDLRQSYNAFLTATNAIILSGGTAPSAANQPVRESLAANDKTETPVLTGVPVAGAMFRSESKIALPSTDGEAARAVQPSSHAQALVQEGKALYDAGKLSEAEVKLQEAVKENPQSQAGYYYLNKANEAKYQDALNKHSPVALNLVTNTDNAWYAQANRDLLPRPEIAARRPLQEAALDETTTRGVAHAEQLASAEKNLDDLKRSRTLLMAKIASEKTDADLPKSSTVEVIDRAQPANKEAAGLGEKIRLAFGGEYKSTARVKADRDQSDIAGLQGPQNAGMYDPYFVQTEFEAIQSPTVLGRVVQDLHLDEEWAKKRGSGTKLSNEEAVALLKKRLNLKPVRNTDLIEIDVKDKNPEEAAKIANAVADSYLNFRHERRQKIAVAERGQLHQRLDEENVRIREAESNVNYLRKQPNAPDANPASGALTPGLNVNVPPAAIIQQTDAPPPKPALPIPEPQPEVQTAENAFSTFSMNVSDVSFKLAAASLEKGQLPEPGSIRSEEFVNAFDYRDPEAPAGVPVAFAWDRARYSFAQGRDLLRFSLKTAAQGRQAGRPLNLVLLLDNSGSMERADRVQIIHEALRVLATQLSAQDVLSVVTFARTPRLWVDGAPGTQAAQIADEVGGLTPQGGTNLGDALDLAYQTALRHYLANGINRVVLLTDGAANLGDVDPDSLKKKVEANRKQGIALDCFGIGWEGYNDDLLELLSRNADGRYGFLNTPEEAATEFASQLAGALRVAASDVKVQVEFNPSRVTAYRQIGYAKLQLTKEQFRDNTVPAAQIGAAETGNALYVIDVNGGGDGPLATVRVRYRLPGTSDYREQEWTVPYTGTAAALEQSSPALRLAASASAFSEWLATSPYAADVTPDRLLGYLNGVPDVYGADARPRKLESMIRQAKSLAGK